MIHRFDLTVKKELTKESKRERIGAPDYGFLHCAEGELIPRTKILRRANRIGNFPSHYSRPQN